MTTSEKDLFADPPPTDFLDLDRNHPWHNSVNDAEKSSWQSAYKQAMQFNRDPYHKIVDKVRSPNGMGRVSPMQPFV